MRKSVVLFATIVLLLFFTSSYKVQEVGLKLNAYIPEMNLSVEDSVLNLNKERGNYVLLNFWSSENAMSRIKNIEYSNMINDLNDNKIKFASINYDRSQKLYSEIISNDNVNNDSQFFDYDGINSEVYKQFQLERGFNSYLINKEGKIIAINPNVEQLTAYIGQ